VLAAMIVCGGPVELARGAVELARLAGSAHRT